MNIHVSSLALYVFVVLILFCSTPTEGVIRSSTSSSTQSVLSVGVNTNATADTARSKSRATHAHTNRVEGGGIGDRLKRSARGRVPSFVDPKKQIYDAVADDSPASLERWVEKNYTYKSNLPVFDCLLDLLVDESVHVCTAFRSAVQYLHIFAHKCTKKHAVDGQPKLAHHFQRIYITH